MIPSLSHCVQQLYSSDARVPDCTQLLPTGLSENAPAQDAFAHLTLTLLQQSHLCPLPLVVQPMHWTYDHALQLYPLPHAVVVADAAPQASHKHEGCTVLNPVGFKASGYAAFSNGSARV